MLTELFHYTNQVPAPADALSVQCTKKYLEACNKIFERGLLSHEKILSEDSEVLKNIDEGYAFFLNWVESLQKKGNNKLFINNAHTILKLHYEISI